MQKHNKPVEILIRVIKFLPILIMLVLALLSVYVFFIKGIPFDDLLAYTPSNYFASTIAILVLYAFKSLSIVFPIVAIYIFVGNIYSWYIALLVNLVGLIITLTLPYIVGRISGSGLTEKLLKSYKNINASKFVNPNKVFFTSYFLRVINILPGDLVSMVLGANKFEFKKYILGSLIGASPSMIAITFMGATITEPNSAGFILSAVATGLISIISLIINRRTSKK